MPGLFRTAGEKPKSIFHRVCSKFRNISGAVFFGDDASRQTIEKELLWTPTQAEPKSDGNEAKNEGAESRQK